MDTWMDLGAFGFWMFLAIVVAAGIWGSNKKRESEHETLRRILESDKKLDEGVVEKVLQAGTGNEELERDLRVGGLITLGVAPGLFLFGWILSLTLEPKLFQIMAGVSVLVLFVSLGLLGAAHMVGKRYRQGASSMQDV